MIATACPYEIKNLFYDRSRITIKAETMKRPQLKTILVLMTLMTVLCVQNTSAQAFEYPTYEGDSVRIEVKSKRARPTIADFATAYLDHYKDTGLYAKVNEDWKRYQLKKPLRYQGHFIVDIPNGYLSYEMPGEEYNETIYLEMCYWNCADGKHQLVCCNLKSKADGVYCWREYAGPSFYLYDNDNKKMRTIWAEDLDALYDGNCFSVFFLPRKGKDIRVMVESEGERWNEVLKWDGYKFKSEETP